MERSGAGERRGEKRKKIGSRGVRVCGPESAAELVVHEGGRGEILRVKERQGKKFLKKVSEAAKR